MASKPNKAAARRAELAAWWRRYFWPVILLSVDPGGRAGAAVLRSTKWKLEPIAITGVDTDTREIEHVISIAINMAKISGLPLFMAVEDWGRGGPLGIDQWIGLGAARGAWLRAYRLAIAESEHRDVRIGSMKLLAPDRIVRVNQRTWRSRTIEESGTRDAEGKWTAYDTEQWKVAAQDATAKHFPDFGRVDDPDAAEASLLGHYTARSDELGKRIPKTHLARHGLTFPPRDRLPGRPRIRRRKKSS